MFAVNEERTVLAAGMGGTVLAVGVGGAMLLLLGLSLQ